MQKAIMEQIHEHGGNFVLTVKRNPPDTCEEIHCFMDRLEKEALKEKEGVKADSTVKGYLEKYEEVSRTERMEVCQKYRTGQAGAGSG